MSISKISNAECCGCSLCASICPVKCIEIRQGKDGFSYPVIDKHKCVECGLCEKKCPLLADFKKKIGSAYLGYCKTDSNRKHASSGGLFYLLAVKTLQQGGIVYGAAWDKDLSVRHRRITDENEIGLLTTSKYLQSDMRWCYDSIEQDLNDGINVLFSGTPCQVAAVYQKFKTHRLISNLLLIDIKCHGVPSPGVWKSYIRILENRYQASVISVNFRCKDKGWHNYSLKMQFDNGGIYSCVHDLNPYMDTFLSDKNIRASCLHCKFRAEYSLADITLGDAWGCEKEKGNWSDDKGVSLIITHTKKGQDAFALCKNDTYYKEVKWNQWVGGSLSPATNVSLEYPARIEFFEDYSCLSNKDFWEKYSKLSLKKRLVFLIKWLLRKLKVDCIVRKSKGLLSRILVQV